MSRDGSTLRTAWLATFGLLRRYHRYRVLGLAWRSTHPGLRQAWRVDERPPFDPSDFDYIFADEDSARLLARSQGLV